MLLVYCTQLYGKGSSVATHYLYAKQKPKVQKGKADQKQHYYMCPSYSKLAVYEATCNRIMLVSYTAVNIIMHSYCFQWTLTNMNICCMGLPNI